MFRTSDILFFKIQYLCTQQKGLTSKDDDVVGVSVFFFFILKKKKKKKKTGKTTKSEQSLPISRYV